MVIGVDWKSASWHAVGLAPWTPDGFMLSSHKAPRGTLDAKRQSLFAAFDSFLGAAVLVSQSRQEPLHVFFEHPLALANGKTTLALGMAAGALWAAHLGHDLWWHWVEVSSWAAMVGVSLGKDNTAERKAKSRAYAVEHLALPPDLDEDHYDAANNGLWGRAELAKLPEAWKPEAVGVTDG